MRPAVSPGQVHPACLAGYLLMNVHAPAIAFEPQDRGHQRRAGLHGERGRAAHHLGLLAEELHLHAAAGEIAVTDQPDNLARPQPLDQGGEPLLPAAGRQHLHAKPLAERDEPAVDRLRLTRSITAVTEPAPLATIQAQAKSSSHMGPGKATPRPAAG